MGGGGGLLVVIDLSPYFYNLLVFCNIRNIVATSIVDFTVLFLC